MALHEVPDDGSDVKNLFKVHGLLVGFVERDTRQPRTVFTDPESTEGVDAFAALAMFLRRDKPLPTRIRLMLAGLFDPVASEGVHRRFVLQNRTRGRVSDVFQRRIIAQNIFDLHVSENMKLNEVLEKLSDTFCMDFKTIEKLWYAERNKIASMKGHPELFSKEPKK